MRARFLLEQCEDLFLRWLPARPLGVDRDVIRHVVFRRPVDALRRPDALDQALVHELARPLPEVGEGRGPDIEHVPSLLLQEVRVADAVEVGEDVFLAGNLRQLPPEVLRDFPRLELDRADLVRRHHALEDLSVQFPEEGGPVLHQDEVGDALQDDVVREGGRQGGEVALRHRDLP